GGARLEIRNGIGVNEDTSDLGLQIARNEGSSGAVLVDGEGSIIAVSQAGPSDPDNGFFGPFVTVGRSGQGTLTVSNGGDLTLAGDSAALRTGIETVGNGAVVVDGAGSTVSVDGPDSRIIVGVDGEGALSIENGASVSNSGPGGFFFVGDAATAEGTLRVTGGSALSVEGGTAIGVFGTGNATIDGGSTVVLDSDGFDNLSIGEQEGSTGSLLVDGLGTTVTTTGTDNTVQVGRFGTGDLTVQGGASLSTLQLEAGRGGEGTVTIQGNSTDSVFGGFVRAGRFEGSDGTINVLGGADLIIRNGIGVNEDTTEVGLQIARERGSSGDVLVDGVGSVIGISQAAPADPQNGRFGPFVQVGRDGDGTLTVQNSGALTLHGDMANFVVGDGAGSDGTVVVSGSDSSITLTGGDALMDIGLDGKGEMTVSGGASVAVEGA
ncbi:unnamed protein product, partial [Ectocarpus sp. 13 AM-2016]